MPLLCGFSGAEAGPGRHGCGAPTTAFVRSFALCYRPRANSREVPVVSVIASSVRKGNVIEKDGKLYLVLTAENIHPGKGTPVTHLEMRRISDGVKTVERLRTTDSIEKAFIDQGNYNYLYQDGDHYVFMQPETFDQVSVGLDVIGDRAPYLTENMQVQLQSFEGRPISIEIPQRATFEV